MLFGGGGSKLQVAGLFAGIGGIELGLGIKFETLLFCEIDPGAKAVLQARFPGVPLWDDVSSLPSIPARAEVLTAGFPCQDLSQAGKTAGIGGTRSGLVSHMFELLKPARGGRNGPTWVVIENVRNMLSLDRGRAMEYLVGELEALGYAWAYRVVDTRALGLPQRRQRVLLVASRTEDPRGVLLTEDVGEPPVDHYRQDGFGFYWTEGLRGLGWAQDAIPTLKGGSSLGIPSPPAIWVPDGERGRQFVLPSIEEAEMLQGFPRGWTEPAGHEKVRKGDRWKMVGNAVSVPVAGWLGSRLLRPLSYQGHQASRVETGESWPLAAWGAPRADRYRVDLSMWPQRAKYRHLLQLVDVKLARALSQRATAGFLSRLERSYLRTPDQFRMDLRSHLQVRNEIPDGQLALTS